MSRNLEVLAEKEGKLDLRENEEKSSGAAKERTRKVRLAGAPDGDSAVSQSQKGCPKPKPQPRGCHTQIPQESSTVGLQFQLGGIPPELGPSTSGLQFLGRIKLVQGPDKRQISCGNRPEGGQVKRPKKIRQLCFAKVANEGLKMAIFALENFTNIPRGTGSLVDELPEMRFIPNSSVPPRPKGLPLRRVPGLAKEQDTGEEDIAGLQA
jgi:hypothetical protein